MKSENDLTPCKGGKKNLRKFHGAMWSSHPTIRLDEGVRFYQTLTPPFRSAQHLPYKGGKGRAGINKKTGDRQPPI